MKKVLIFLIVVFCSFNKGFSTIYYACGTGITWDGTTSFLYTSTDCTTGGPVNPNTLTSADEMIIQAGAVITVEGSVTLNAIKLTIYGTLYIHTPAIAGKLTMPENSATIIFESGSTLGCTDDGINPTSCSPASSSQIIVGTGGSKWTYKGSDINDVDALPKPSNLDNMGGSLPIDLIYFSGRSDQRTIKLNWATADEENFSHFVIERSSKADDFYTIGTLDSKGVDEPIVEYDFIDEAPLKGINYYRLKAVDLDGEYAEHAIISVGYEGSYYEDILIYPNPMIENRITIKTNFSFDFAKVRIVDAQGNEYLNSIQQYPSYDFNLSNNMADGIYFVEFNTGLKVFRKRIVKY